MEKRQVIIVVVALAIIVGAVGISKTLKNSKKPRNHQREKVIPTAFIQEVKNTSLPLLIPASGSIIAKHRIKLFSEVQGVLEISKKEFKPGTHFSKGEVLVKLNSDEFYTNLQAQKSSFYNTILSIMPDIRLDFPDSYNSWQEYLDKVQIEDKIKDLPKPLSEKEKLFVAAKNIYTSFFNVKNLEEKFEKFTLRAPYAGILTEATITPGTLVSPGQSIGEFIKPGIFEMEVAVSSSLSSNINIGDEVVVNSLENGTESLIGKVIRINGKVDKNSQTVNVFIELLGKDLKEGMYLKALLKTEQIDNIIEIKRNLLVNENQMFVLKDSAIYLQEIQVLHQNEKTIMVSGLKDGDIILERPVPKAFEGMKVKVFSNK